MLVILSQKVDTESSYSDELFSSYHYPARYRNQLHEGDIFIYYQGNRYDKSHRYYFGVGTVGEIMTVDGENYYAKLINCQRFERQVPIYLPDGGYIEQLGYETVRKSQTPPWQSSVRPISQAAFDYILNSAGIQTAPDIANAESIVELKEKLKSAIRAFYVEGDQSAIYRIENIASAIGRGISRRDQRTPDQPARHTYLPADSSADKAVQLIEYCRGMKMSYSYKAVLILALLHAGDRNGCIALEKAVEFFRNFYTQRRLQGQTVEKKKCIYLKNDVTNKQIADNLLVNPIRVLVDSGFFFYSIDTQVFSMSPEIWISMDRGKKSALTKACNLRLKEYYGE